jgi:hypothetical protein
VLVGCGVVSVEEDDGRDPVFGASDGGVVSRVGRAPGDVQCLVPSPDVEEKLDEDAVRMLESCHVAVVVRFATRAFRGFNTGVVLIEIA